MNCPFCGAQETKVIDSRLITEGRQVRRRRECTKCNERYTTYESPEFIMPSIVKRDGRKESFNEDNLRAGILVSLRKRPVSIDDIESAMGRIKHRLQSCGQRELSSDKLGEWVMNELKQLDEVAYIRFASVYRSFQDIKDFNSEINKLHAEHEEV